MILQIIKKSSLLAVSAVLSSSLAYGQATIAPVVPPDSVGPGEYRPYSWVVVPADGSATINAVHAPGQGTCNSGNACFYNEGDIWTAYGLPPLQARGHYGQGITIGIVDAFYDPQIAANLQTFSTFFHLPLGTASTTINCSSTPTFTVVNQTGGSPTGVSFNAGWAEEANLDVQQAHAMAPCANILLIAGNSASFGDLGTGVQYAYAHADLVSNSYGANEFGGETSLDSLYSGSPVPLLFSSGDAGAVSQYPCASTLATCVGGTNLLTTAASFRTQESAWGEPNGGTGGGCSGQVGRPGYQNGFTNPICGAGRGVPDVAALADPYTGVDISLSTNVGVPSNGTYCCIGGTSLAAPLTTGVLANVENARVSAGKSKLGPGLNTLLYQAAGYSPTGISSQPAPYGSAYRSFYFDVYLGNSGFPATTFWDRTTGLGVPYFSSLGNYLITTVP